MTRQEEKQQLRTTIRQMEAALAPGYLQNSDAAIAAHLLAMPEYQSAGTIFCFVGIWREIDTRPHPAPRAKQRQDRLRAPSVPHRARWSCGGSPPWRNSGPANFTFRSRPLMRPAWQWTR